MIPTQAAQAGPQAATLPLSQIQAARFQPRQTTADQELEALVESVRAHGLLQPLLVRPLGEPLAGQVAKPIEAGYELIAGTRRLEAARRAGLASVPVYVRECTDRQAAELSLVENLQREDMNPMDVALAYKRVATEFHLTQEELSAAVGKSRSSVANTLRLLDLPPSAQESLRQGRISQGHARALLGAVSQQRMQELCAIVERKGLSVRETERLVSSGSRVVPRGKTEDPNIVALQRLMEQALATRVRISRRGQRGKVTIEFYGQEELERIIEAVTGRPLSQNSPSAAASMQSPHTAASE